MFRETPDPEHLLRKRDRAPIIYVPASTWVCILCEREQDQAEEQEGLAPEELADRRQARDRENARNTTVVWLGPHTNGPSGRCRECGQKYELAATNNPDHVPAPEDQKWPRLP